MRLFASGVPSSCVAGQVFGVSAGAQYCSSGSWVNDPTYGGAITLSTTDPAVGSQAWQYGPNDGGAHTFSYQPKTASSQTVTAADNLGTSPASMSTAVQPGPLNHVVIDRPMNSPIMTGDTVSVCFNPNGAAVETHGNWIGATLYDAFNNATTSSHTFRVVTGDPQATAPDLTTATSTLRWGQCAAAPINDGVTFQNAGTYSVRVTDLVDTGIVTSNPESVVVNSNPQLRVDILGIGSGAVTSNPPGINCSSGSCSMSVAAGTTVALSEQSGSGSSFVGWGGACSGVGGCTVTLNSDQTVSASFDNVRTFACGGSQCGGGAVPAGDWRPYADNSPFNRVISATARTLPNSSQIIGRMLGDIAATKQPSNLLIATDGSTGWPTYWGRGSDPAHPSVAPDPVDGISCGGTVNGVMYPSNCDVSSMGVHAPGGAQVQGEEPTADADRHMTIIDQTNGFEFDLWRESESPLGSTTHIIPTIFSGYSSVSGTGLALSVIGEGNAGRFGNLAGRIRFEELTNAINAGTSLRHALTITVNCTTSTPISPASSSNSGRTCSNLVKPPDPNLNINAPPMGARIHLKLTIDQINGLNLPAWKKVLLRTMSVYGAIINDTGSNNYFDWQYESGNQYTSVGGSDPWLPWAHSLSDQQKAGTRITNFFPWDDSGLPDCTPACVGANCTPHCIGFKGLWNTDEDVAANVWTSDNLEVMDACVSDGSC
jgi:hypothetical protein